MGLRETNAARTKSTITEAAMSLFLDGGYEGTTMEDVAHRADVSTTTLYRYFSSKESIIIGLLGDPGMMADELRRRPDGEPAEVALGHALVAFLSFASMDREADRKFRELLEANARPRARLMEWFGDMHARLVIALEERLTGAAASLHAGAMAWTAIFVLQRATESARTDTGERDAATIAVEVMRDLAQDPLMTPRIEHS